MLACYCADTFNILKKYNHNMKDVDLELLSVYGIDRYLFVADTVHLIKLAGLSHAQARNS